MYFCGVACNFSLIFKIYLGLFSFFLISLAKCLSIFFIFSKNQELFSLLFSIFAIIYFIYFHLDLHSFFLSFFLSFFVMILDFACSCFSSSFDVKLGGLFQFFFVPDIRTSLFKLLLLCCIDFGSLFPFSFVSRYFLFPVWFIQWPTGFLVAYCLASMFVGFASFFIADFYSHSIVVRKMIDMVSIFLNLLRLVLCPSMRSILKNIWNALEKNILSAPLE